MGISAWFPAGIAVDWGVVVIPLLLLACAGQPSGERREDSDLPGDTALEGDSEVAETAEVPVSTGPTCRLHITPSAAAAPADGRPAITVRVRATDLDGAALPDGTVVRLHASSGALEPLPPLQGGEASTRLHSATRPGRVWVGSPDCALAQQVELVFTPLAAWSAQLHIHGSLSEGTGTMRGFSRAADEDGLDLLWWTDHDLLYHNNPDLSLSTLDWEEGGLSGTIAGTAALGPSEWTVSDLGGLERAELVVNPFAAARGGYGLRASVTGEDLRSPDTRRWRIHAKNLSSAHGTLGGVQISFKVRRQMALGAQLRVVVPLSSNGGRAGAERRIVFHDGDTRERDTADTLWVAIGGGSGEWTEVVADISALADANWPDDERDLSAGLVDVELAANPGGRGAWDLDDFRFSQRVVGDDLRDAQRDLLDEYAAANGIDTRSWVGAELSGFGEPHLNAFGSDTLLFDYDRPAGWGPADAVAEVHASGGLVSYNHMFGVEMEAFTDAERAELVHDQVELLAANNRFGVDLLEVGYRHRGGLIGDFLEVWDALSIRGLYTTGIGTSDVHNDTSWATTANNFVTWVAAAELDEAELLWNLRRGAAWFGDPRKFREGEVSVSVLVPAAGASQGQVVVGMQGPAQVTFAASELELGWTVRAIVDGEELERTPVLASGPFVGDVTIDPRGGKVVRFEVLDGQEDGILYSNPVYFSDTDEGVPAERLPRP